MDLLDPGRAARNQLSLRAQVGTSMTGFSRRAAMGLGMAGLAGCALAPSDLKVLKPTASPAVLAQDEAYWAKVAAIYDLTHEVTQLENANWGVIAKPVMAAYQANLEMVNRRNSYYVRREYPQDAAKALARAAAAFGVAPDEFAFTRNATEALQGLIGGYNRLKPGDAVLYADHDYDSTITVMQWLKTRRSVDVVKISLPEPATPQNVFDCYEAALKANPKVRMMLLTHMSHRNGLVIPVAKISEMARARNVDVIVDAAHSFGQVEFKLPDLKADFVGVNLHKWLGAPLGVGGVYIRKERIADIDTAMGDPERSPPSVASRIHPGTVDFAALLTVPDALDLHEAIGVDVKAARLRYLRDVWAEDARKNPAIEVLTPNDPAMHGGITSFRLAGRTSDADNITLAKRLLDEYGIFTVYRPGLAKGACIRVAPGVFTPVTDVVKLRDALRKITAS
jgi:selenocysteine lyase/cysteine desulfurase